MRDHQSNLEHAIPLSAQIVLVFVCFLSPLLTVMSQDTADQQRRLLALLTTVIAVSGATAYSEHRYDPIPFTTSALTGRMWVNELLDGHPDRVVDNLGIHKDVFLDLCKELQPYLHPSDSRADVEVEEAVAMFLYMGRHNSGHRVLRERFQRSLSTISKYV